MAQEGTSPVPSQDHTHISNLSPSTTSKTPRTLSFINNVQTAVAQIEDKLANTPSASPPRPNRNEIPVTHPGPDHPVVDRVQFLESSLAISPSKRSNICSLAESVFGGAINPDPSLASAGVFVSTTPRTNLNAPVTYPSGSSTPSNPGSQAATHVINDPTANDTSAAPSIAPIVEQFETPITPVSSKENDSDIVGAPIAPIVEQFEGPVTVTGTINQQDLVDFASGTVAPIVNQFEYSTRPEPESGILEQAETSDGKQAVTDSQRVGAIEELQAPPQETADTVGNDSAKLHDEAAQASTSGADGSQDRSRGVQNLSAVPFVEDLDSSLDESLESGSPSNDEVIQTETTKSETKPLTVLDKDGATATSSLEDHASSQLDGVSIAKASRSDSHDMHKDTDATSESSESKRTAIGTNYSETGEKCERHEPGALPETELLFFSQRPPLLSVGKEEDTSIITTATTVLPTKTCAKSIDINSSRDAFVDNDRQTTETSTAPESTEFQAKDAGDDGPVDETKVEDLETERVETVAAHGKEDNTSLEDCMLSETTEAASVETLKSIDGKSTKFATNAAANGTTTSIVSPKVQTSDDEFAIGDATDNSSSVDETAKTRVYETASSGEGVNNSAIDENASTEVPTASATDIVDSTCAESKSDRESTMADEAMNPQGTETPDPTSEAVRAPEMQTSDPTVCVDSPVTEAIPSNRSSIASESVRPVDRLVEDRSILNSTGENRSKDATTLATESGTPEIQLDNSVNVTIVVQTNSATVSAEETISTDDSTRVDKYRTPKSAPITSQGVQTAAEDSFATGPAHSVGSETVYEGMQANEIVSARTTTVSSAEIEAVDYVKEKEVTFWHRNERVSETSHEEHTATPEQESLDTVKRRALFAHQKLASSCPDRAVKSPCDRSLETDSFPETDKSNARGMLETLCDSSTIALNRGVPRGESVGSKSSSPLELQSPVVSSNGANIETGGRTHRQSFSRGAITASPGTKKTFSTVSSVQEKQKKPPQRAPPSPLRRPKSSSQSLPRLPRIAGLSNTRRASSVRSRSSLTEGTSRGFPRSSTQSSSIPRPNSRVSSPLLTRKSGLSLSPVTPKSASKPSRTPRLPLRRTLSFTKSRMFDSPSLASSRTRYSLSQKVEEMKRASGNQESAGHLSGSGSKPPLGRRPRVTVPEPFALFGPELHEMSEKQMDNARRKQDEEAARPRVFKPRPMPKFSKANGSQLVRKDETKNKFDI